MNRNLSYNYFDDAINQLVSVLGVTEHVDADKFVSLATKSAYDECIAFISEQYGLSLKYNITIVPEGYSNNKRYFKTTGLSRVSDDGKGTEGITAQVRIPDNLPLYSSPNLNNITINVIVGEECSKVPETFITVMTHEIAHLLLEILRLPEKHNEIYVDLVPLIFGFGEIITKGRKNKIVTYNLDDTKTTHTTTYGYMLDWQFYHSKKRIKGILEIYRKQKLELGDTLNTAEMKSKELKNELRTFKELLAAIENQMKSNIAKEDGARLVNFFSLNYLDAFNQTIESADEIISETNLFFSKLTHYHASSRQDMNFYNAELSKLITELNMALNATADNISLIKDNLRLGYKLRLALNSFINKDDKTSIIFNA